MHDLANPPLVIYRIFGCRFFFFFLRVWLVEFSNYFSQRLAPVHSAEPADPPFKLISIQSLKEVRGLAANMDSWRGAESLQTQATYAEPFLLILTHLENPLA